MNILTKGTPARLDDIPNGQSFTFETGNNIAIGIKIAYPQSPNSCVLVLTRKDGQPPKLQDRHEAPPTIIYSQPTMVVVTGAAPSKLRNGVRNPQPGHLMQFGDDTYIGFVDEHNDPSSASLKTGLINPNPINGPVAIFEAWQIALHSSGESEIVFDYPSIATSKAV
jgi:hypothetical protein